MGIKLWVDDERPAPDDSWTSAKSSNEAISFFNTLVVKDSIDEVSLDHDLGGEDNGMKVLEFIIEHHTWPKILTIHTMNPVARKRMLQAANAEAPPEVDIYHRIWT